MKKLNNKGITTIEVIITFVLVTIITISMYSTVSAFNTRRVLENNKEKIYTYKNILTKVIQDDFIKIGISSASYQKNVDASTTTYTVDCSLKDGTKRQLVIIQRFAKSSYHLSGGNVDDYYMIKYGKPDDMIEYPIPELGEYKTDEGKIAKDFSINNVLINIKDDSILSIYIGFYHPELGTRYSINIVSPINYYQT